MAKALKSIKAQIETLQSRYRATSAMNNGVIKGAIETDALQQQITNAMREYNATAKSTMYYGGKIVSRKSVDA